MTVDRREQQRVLRFGLRNESAKLNLARLLRWEQTQPGSGRAAMLQLPGMTEAAADCLLDWIDADDVTREFGAEAEYYEILNRPYRPRNELPTSLEELLFVKGIDRSFLFPQTSSQQNPDFEALPESGALRSSDLATDMSGNGMSGNQGLTAAGSGTHVSGFWEEFLSLYSAERNVNSVGRPRVFLNAPDLASLEQQLAPEIDEQLGRFILLARVYGLRTDGVSGVEPLDAPFSGGLTAAFPIRSLADLIDANVLVTGPGGTVTVLSPLRSASPEFAELWLRLSDRASTDPESIIPGRINLLEAPETVVRMLPGMTTELASQMITVRTSLDASERSSLAWLLTRDVMDVATFRTVFPEVTTGGDVFQAEIIAHRPIGGPVLRRNVIIDAAASPPRRVNWREMTDDPMWVPLQVLNAPFPP